MCIFFDNEKRKQLSWYHKENIILVIDVMENMIYFYFIKAFFIMRAFQGKRANVRTIWSVVRVVHNLNLNKSNGYLK